MVFQDLAEQFGKENPRRICGGFSPIQRLSAGGAGGITSVGGVTSRGTERVSGAATVTGTVIGSAAGGAVFSGRGAAALVGAVLVPVSYTHLTLPTKRIV